MLKRKAAAKPTPLPVPPATPRVETVSKAAPTPKSSTGVEAKPAPSRTPLPAIKISHEAIAQAAYYRWQRFGGDEQSNWHLAEQELRDEAARLA